MKPTQPLLPAQVLKPRARQLQRMKHILMGMIMVWIMLLLMMVVLMTLFL